MDGDSGIPFGNRASHRAAQEHPGAPLPQAPYRRARRQPPVKDTVHFRLQPGIRRVRLHDIHGPRLLFPLPHRGLEELYHRGPRIRHGLFPRHERHILRDIYPRIRGLLHFFGHRDRSGPFGPVALAKRRGFPHGSPPGSGQRRC